MTEVDPRRQQRAMTQYLASRDEQPSKPASSSLRQAPAGWYHDPTMANTRRYWDGGRWTGHVVPSDEIVTAPARESTLLPPPEVDVQPPGPPGQMSATALTEPTLKDDATWAWVLAVSPFLWLPFDYFAPDFSASLGVFIAAVVISTGLAIADEERVKDRLGVHVSGYWALLLVPIYLIVRTVKARSTPLIPIVWIVGFAISVLGSYTFAAAYTFGGYEDESSIEQELSDQGVPHANITCPDETVTDGDVVWCTVTAAGESAEIRVEIDEDGSYSWVLS